MELELENYIKAKNELSDLFGIGSLWYNLIDCTDEEWTDNNEDHGTIEYELKGEEFQYGFDVYGTSRWYYQNYVLFVGDNCCGDRDFYLFNNDNKIDG